MAKLKLGVLISGQGTNLEAILRACDSGAINAEVRATDDVAFAQEPVHGVQVHIGGHAGEDALG